jgi:hypothetical protein
MAGPEARGDQQVRCVRARQGDYFYSRLRFDRVRALVPDRANRGGHETHSQEEILPKGFAGLAEPVIALSLRREFLAGLGELRELLENGVVAAS